MTNRKSVVEKYGFQVI